MKRFFYAMTIALVTLTSCAADDDFPQEGQPEGKDELTTISISATLPEYTQLTRVSEDEPNIPGKGTKISKLQYAVFDENGKIMYHSGQPNAPEVETDHSDHGHYTLKVQLFKQQTYTFYIWASAENSPYTFHQGNGRGDKNDSDNYPYMTIDYMKVKANDETMDAFFGKKTFQIKDDVTSYTVILNRPFDQLNILINDRDAITQAILNGTDTRVLKSVTVKIKDRPGRYQRLDLHTFIASDPLEEVLEISADFPDGWNDMVHAGDGDIAHYYYLATCYLLTGTSPYANIEGATADQLLTGGVGTEKEVTGLDIITTFTDDTDITLTKENVPIQRSWRTNIYGPLLTSTVNVECRIDFNFSGSYGDGPGAVGENGSASGSGGESID